jgi:hypothetical protein
MVMHNSRRSSRNKDQHNEKFKHKIGMVAMLKTNRPQSAMGATHYSWKTAREFTKVKYRLAAACFPIHAY